MRLVFTLSNSPVGYLDPENRQLEHVQDGEIQFMKMVLRTGVIRPVVFSWISTTERTVTSLGSRRATPASYLYPLLEACSCN